MPIFGTLYINSIFDTNMDTVGWVWIIRVHVLLYFCASMYMYMYDLYPSLNYTCTKGLSLRI